MFATVTNPPASTTVTVNNGTLTDLDIRDSGVGPAGA